MAGSVSLDARFRLGLQKVLARLADRSSFSLVQADLADADADIRGGAIRLIGDLGLSEYLPNITERLQKLYGREQSTLELQFTLDVFYALKKIGTREISEELSRKFEQITDRVKPSALEVIAAHGSTSADIDRFFQGLIRPDTPYPKLRVIALNLYASMAFARPDARSVIQQIRKYIKDPDPHVASAAAGKIAHLLGERTFELPEWRSMAANVQADILSNLTSVPSPILEEALKSKWPAVQTAAAHRVLAADHPSSALRDIVRLYSASDHEKIVVGDRLMAGLGRWNESKNDRIVLVQIFLYLLKRHAGVLEKFLPASGAAVGAMDKLLARLRRAMLRSGTEKIQDELILALSKKASPAIVMASVADILRQYPKEEELHGVIQEVLGVGDERIRMRIATELRAIPGGAFIPIKKILRVLPPLRDQSLIPSLRVVRDLAKYHQDAELEWLALMHLAASGEASALSSVCDAILREGAMPAPGVKQPIQAQADVTPWIRALSSASTTPKVRKTLLAILRLSDHPNTFRAAVEILSSRADAEVSNLLMFRLPALTGAMRFTAIQSLGRLGDRVHLPVFLSEMRADAEDRRLAGLLGLEKLFDANPELPPDTVTAALYALRGHPSRYVRLASIALLTRIKDANRVDLVAELILSEGPIPVNAYRLLQDLAEEKIDDADRHKLFQSLVTRIGRMTDDEEAVSDAFKSVLGGKSFSEFLKPRRQRADKVEDLKQLLRKRAVSKATTDFQIAKSIHRRAIAFLDITGFTPRAARMSAIELGVFLVQVEDEIQSFIDNHNGTLVKRLGDGFLVSFPSSAHALASALETLHYLAHKNQLLQEEDRIRLRAGIHVGDVLIDRDDIFGDTVNIAARVEALAKPMCICFTEDVFQEIPKKNDAIEYMGPTRLKGKDEPIPLYCVRFDVIYESQTEAIQKLLSTPDLIPKIKQIESRLEERYARLKEKLDEAKHMADHGDLAHAETLIEDIEKSML